MITGATGYIASWVVKFFLEEGFTDTATVQDAKNKQKRKHLGELAKHHDGDIIYFETDLLKNGSYEEAMQGCQIVLHTASPFLLESKNPQQELIDPALKGTMNILESVNNTKAVKRVILTSSVAAIYGDAIDSFGVPNRTFDETMWNTTSSMTNNEYSYSKTLAEKKAWEVCKKQNRWDLISINPSFVVGQALNPLADFQSKKSDASIRQWRLKVWSSDLTLGMVDVRDVGKAHLQAAINSSASGRYILSSESISFLKLGEILKDSFGNTYPFPKRKAPKFLFWILAPFFGVKRNFVSNNVGYGVFFNNEKSREDFKHRIHTYKKICS